MCSCAPTAGVHSPTTTDDHDRSSASPLPHDPLRAARDRPPEAHAQSSARRTDTRHATEHVRRPRLRPPPRAHRPPHATSRRWIAAKPIRPARGAALPMVRATATPAASAGTIAQSSCLLAERGNEARPALASGVSQSPGPCCVLERLVGRVLRRPPGDDDHIGTSRRGPQCVIAHEAGIQRYIALDPLLNVCLSSRRGRLDQRVQQDRLAGQVGQWVSASPDSAACRTGARRSWYSACSSSTSTTCA